MVYIRRRDILTSQNSWISLEKNELRKETEQGETVNPCWKIFHSSLQNYQEMSLEI